MIQISNVKAPVGYDKNELKTLAAKKLRCSADEIGEIRVIRYSLDARKKTDIHFVLTLAISAQNERRLLKKCPEATEYKPFAYKKYEKATFRKRPIVVGAGPAGLFAALTLAKSGAKPLLIERGKSVENRAEAVDNFRRTRKLDVNTNIQFGEGGAGTFSDGKLTTGTKDKRIAEVFHEFVDCGAPDDILSNAKPHIGTDKLLLTVRNLREKIIALGGEVIFEATLVAISEKNGKIDGITYIKDEKSYSVETDYLVLATGHSARDTFAYLKDKGVQMSRKPFAVGMRIEHLQSRLNNSMYGCENSKLPPADYKLAVHLPSGRGVYTFCMCPGGEVVAAASEENTVVTNGMSYYSRNGKNANSAVLVEVRPDDFPDDDVLSGVEFQRKIERSAFISGGENYNAPIILSGDFLLQKLSDSLGDTEPSYRPGISFSMPDSYLPDFVCNSIREAMPLFAQKISCFGDYDAVFTGAETRSSSPVRINRNECCESLSLRGLFPCGEGAGYAGGIVSAAVDGIRCAESILNMQK